MHFSPIFLASIIYLISVDEQKAGSIGIGSSHYRGRRALASQARSAWFGSSGGGHVHQKLNARRLRAAGNGNSKKQPASTKAIQTLENMEKALDKVGEDSDSSKESPEKEVERLTSILTDYTQQSEPKEKIEIAEDAGDSSKFMAEVVKTALDRIAQEADNDNQKEKKASSDTSENSTVFNMEENVVEEEDEDEEEESSESGSKKTRRSPFTNKHAHTRFMHRRARKSLKNRKSPRYVATVPEGSPFGDYDYYDDDFDEKEDQAQWIMEVLQEIESNKNPLGTIEVVPVNHNSENQMQMIELLPASDKSPQMGQALLELLQKLPMTELRQKPRHFALGRPSRYHRKIILHPDSQSTSEKPLTTSPTNSTAHSSTHVTAPTPAPRLTLKARSSRLGYHSENWVVWCCFVFSLACVRLGLYRGS